MKTPMCLSSSCAPPANESLSQTRARLRRATACALTILLLCNAALGASVSKAAKKPAPKVVKVTEAKPTAVKAADEGRISFKLTITGKGFGTSRDAVSLALLNADGEDAVEPSETAVDSVEPTKIVVQVVASPGPYSLRLKIGKIAADTAALGPLSPDVNGVDASGAEAKSPAHIGIEHEQFAYPSDGGLQKYALVVTRKDEGDKFFESDPRLVSLSLTPAGAADITIRRVTPTRVEADFWAPAKYEVKDVSVSVYDPKDPHTVVASSDVPKPPAQGDAGGTKTASTSKSKSESDQQPEITSTVVVFLQRSYGIGRLKIEGKNFGDYDAPPLSAEDYLLCYEPLARQALVRALEDDYPNPDAQRKLEDQRCADLKIKNAVAGQQGNQAKNMREAWEDWRAKVEPLVKVALVPRNTDLRIEQTKILYIDDKMIDIYFEFNRYYRFSEPLRLASTTVTVKKPVEADQKPAQKPRPGAGETAIARAQGGVINAMMGSGGGEEVKPTAVTTPHVERKTFIATKEVGTRQDENLEYRYTVLDNGSAETLFGRGVAHNFYVIQLSVTNKGDKKIAVPLASIQAEVEWAFGPNPNAKGGGDKEQAARKKDNDKENDKGDSFTAPAYVSAKNDSKGNPKNGSKNGSGGASEETPNDAEASIPFSKNSVKDYYEEGPATLAPLPLAAVTAFFDGDEKVNGKKAKFFNIADGLATLGSSLIPFFGPGFKDAHIAFTGGLVPGIRRGLGDLSSQQLQTLTAMSWQGVEVVAAKGGSIEKFVFIQRGDQVFSPGFGERLRKTIKNIQGMEVVGFEVIESEPKRATPAGQQ